MPVPVVATSSPLDQFLSQRKEIETAVARVLESGNYVGGPETTAFESELAAYLECEHAVSVNSGTDALYLALRALNIGPESEVITVSHTALATVAAIVATGATPVLVDVEPDTMVMNIDRVSNAIGARTKAILPVHLYGHPVDMTRLIDLANAHSIPVVEDCAQAFGAHMNGKKLGSFGTMGCFSFYPTKNLGALGDAGAVTTNDDELATRLRQAKQYGWDSDRVAQTIGINSRMDEIQAAVLRTKLKSIDDANAARQSIAATYDQFLSDTNLITPLIKPGCSHVYHLYVVKSDKRDDLRSALLNQGLQAGIHYSTPTHKHPGYAGSVRVAGQGDGESELPVTEALVSNILSIPIYPELESQAEVIATKIKVACDTLA